MAIGVHLCVLDVLPSVFVPSLRKIFFVTVTLLGMCYILQCLHIFPALTVPSTAHEHA